MTHKIKIKVRIHVLGTKKVVSFFKKYSMEEHLKKQYIKDGNAYALKNLGLSSEQIKVSDIAIVKKDIFKEIKRIYKGFNNYYCKLHNPKKSDFKSHKKIKVNGHWVLVKTIKDKIIFSMINTEWEDELHLEPIK